MQIRRRKFRVELDGPFQQSFDFGDLRAVMSTVLPLPQRDGVVVVRFCAFRLQCDEAVKLFDGMGRRRLLGASYFPQE